MTRPITKKDLLLSILSMDSYHRGYEITVTVATFPFLNS